MLEPGGDALRRAAAELEVDVDDEHARGGVRAAGHCHVAKPVDGVAAALFVGGVLHQGERDAIGRMRKRAGLARQHAHERWRRRVARDERHRQEASPRRGQAMEAWHGGRRRHGRDAERVARAIESVMAVVVCGRVRCGIFGRVRGEEASASRTRSRDNRDAHASHLNAFFKLATTEIRKFIDTTGTQDG
eukprot:3855016-Prymnesium_polylepis.1